jgi:hypothetical protein
VSQEELKKQIRALFLESRDLAERIKAIKGMNLEPGTETYKIWMDEMNFLRREWIKVMDRYLKAFKELTGL